MWWYIGILSYMTVGFLTFRGRYARRMAKALFDLHKAKQDYEADKKRNRGYASPGAEYRLGDAKRRANRENQIFDSIPMAIFWFVYIFAWLGKLVYKVLFRGDIDRAAKKRSQKLIADYNRVQELEAENERLMNLAKQEGLIDK